MSQKTAWEKFPGGLCIIKMNYQQLLQKGKIKLTEAGVPEADVDAFELLSFAARFSRKEYFTRMTEEVERRVEEAYGLLIEKRSARIPLQQIVGHVGFWNLDFIVNEHVLCPRQDTEILVEQAQKILLDGMSVLDVCTGTGCILISLMSLRHGIEGTGVDVSKEAIAVAKENAKRNFVHPRFKQGSLFEPVKGERFDLIVSNPPYIPTQVIAGLMPEVRDHEPHIALDGGRDGLDFYRRIIKEAPTHLCDNGWLFFEVGVGEANSVLSLMEESGFSDLARFKDYADNERVVRGRYHSLNGS